MLFVSSSILIILYLFSIGVYSVYGDSSSPSMFLKGSVPYGIPYEDWVERWWNWNIQIPSEQHPSVYHPKLTDCVVGESESVSFLTPNLNGKSQYSCTIPAKNAILVPISTGHCPTFEAKSNALEDMIKCATEGDKYLWSRVSIDDVPLLTMDPTAELDQKIYVKTKIFNVTIPENNFLNQTAGQWKDAAGGYFIFLKPLPEGDHRLSISARVTNPFDESFNYNYDTSYLLKVQ